MRNLSEEQVILEVIQKHFKRTVDSAKLFGYDGGTGSLTSRRALELIRREIPEFSHLVWIPEMLKVAVLIHRAVQFDEPILLVGTTG